MRYFISAILFLAIIFLSFQLYRLARQGLTLQKETAELITTTEPLRRENRELRARLESLKNPSVIEKELRRAGYAAPGEKVYIIVPQQTP